MYLQTSRFRLIALWTTMVIAAVMSRTANAQASPPKGPSYGGSVPNSERVASGIAWYGVLQDGLDEARRRKKPILFVTAAPQCGGVPGMW